MVHLLTRSASLVLIFCLAWVSAQTGPDSLGIFALFTATEACVLALCSGGGFVLARRVSHFGAAPGSALSALVFAALAVGVCLGLLLGLSSWWAPSAYSWLWLLALGLPWLVLTPNVSGLWLGQGRPALIGWADLGGPAIALMGWAIAVWIGAPNTVLTVLLMWVLARSVVGWLSLVWALRSTGWAAPDGSWLRAQAGPMLMVGLTQLASVASHRVDVLLVEHHLGLKSAGIYFVASSLAGILGFVCLAISRAYRPHVGTPCKEPAATTVLWIVHFSLVLTLVLGIPVWGLVAWLVPWGMGSAYADVGVLLAAFLPAALAYAPVLALSAYFANHAGRPLSMAPGVVAVASAGLNTLLCWGLVPRWGLIGAAWSTAISHGLALACLICLFKGHAKQSWRTVLGPEAFQRRLGAFRTWGASNATGSQQSRVGL